MEFAAKISRLELENIIKVALKTTGDVRLTHLQIGDLDVNIKFDV